MRLYLIPVMGICFAVDGLLLFASNKLTQGPGKPLRLLFGAQLGALYAAACLRYDLPLMGSVWGRVVCQLLVGVAGCGVSLSGLITTAVYLLLSMASMFLAGAMGGREVDLAVAAVLVTVLCGLWMLQKNGAGRTVPIELRYGTARLQLKALRDTGNTLCDPLTGDSVLVLGPDAAKTLLGLELQQVKNPVSTLAQSNIPGLRLIPYRTISGRGLLLAIRIKDAQIGRTRKSAVVAFAPVRFGTGEGFQALTGGAI